MSVSIFAVVAFDRHVPLSKWCCGRIRLLICSRSGKRESTRESLERGRLLSYANPSQKGLGRNTILAMREPVAVLWSSAINCIVGRISPCCYPRCESSCQQMEAST